MTLDQFIVKYNGKYVEFNNDQYKFQCVDLMRQYVKEVLGLNPYVIPAAGTAKQIYLNFKDNQYFRKIANTPTGVPQKGDTVFWGWYPFVTGWAGHVSVFCAGNASKFISFD